MIGKMLVNRCTLAELEHMEQGVADCAFEKFREIISEFKHLLPRVCNSIELAGSGCNPRSRDEVGVVCLDNERRLFLSVHGTFCRLSPCDFGGNHFHVEALDLKAIEDIPPGVIGEYLKMVVSQAKAKA